MALGMTAHAVGTSVALQESEECGAFAALAMSLMGVATALFLPLAVSMVVKEMSCEFPAAFPAEHSAVSRAATSTCRSSRRATWT